MTDALVMRRGDDKTFEITALDKDGNTADLTNCDLWFTAKRYIGDIDNDAMISKTTGGGGIEVPDPQTGIAEVTVDAADTSDFTSKNGDSLFWDLQMLGADGKITTLASGILVVKADITRAIAL